MVWIPDCSSPEVQEMMADGRLPKALCSYPPETLAKICERQPSLCQPYDGSVPPSVWEPIWGTVTSVGDRIIGTTSAVGQGALGTLDLASTLIRYLPYLLVGYGVYLFMDATRGRK